MDDTVTMQSPLSFWNRFFKRSFDMSLSFLGICLTWWIIGIAYNQ
jgi:lipopolysaccharide/colanic/teichoic acid biosynthesis glycosyltransferase